MKRFKFIQRSLMALCVLGLLCSANANSKTGQVSGVLKDSKTGKAYTKYEALVPSKVKSKQNELGLIVLLHGKGGNEKQGIASASIALKEAKSENDYILLGIKSRDAGWGKHDFPNIRKAVEWALKTYPAINPRKVFGIGYSSGAICYGNFAAQAEDLFAGVSLWAGSCKSFPKGVDAGDTGVQYYIIHGEKDPVVKPKNILNAVATMRKSGTRHVFHNIRNGNHGAPYSKNIRPVLWPDMIRWFNSIRNSKIALDPKEKANVDYFTKRVEKGYVITQRDVAKLRDIAGAELNDLLLKMATHKEQVNQRSFLEFCKIRFVGPSLMKEVIKLTNSKYGAVKKEANEILRKAVHWHATEVIDYLCQTAVNNDLNLDVRKNALSIMQEYYFSKALCVIDNNWIKSKLSILEKDSNRFLKDAYKSLIKK